MQHKHKKLDKSELRDWFSSMGISKMCGLTGISRWGYYRYISGEVKIPYMLQVIKNLLGKNAQLRKDIIKLKKENWELKKRTN